MAISELFVSEISHHSWFFLAYNPSHVQLGYTYIMCSMKHCKIWNVIDVVHVVIRTTASTRHLYVNHVLCTPRLHTPYCEIRNNCNRKDMHNIFWHFSNCRHENELHWKFLHFFYIYCICIRSKTKWIDCVVKSVYIDWCNNIFLFLK